MKAELQVVDKMHILVNIDGYEIHMDGTKPYGDEVYPSPKQLLLASMGGCTIMDVVSLLKKYKQNYTSIKMSVDAEAVKTQPQIFTESVMQYFVEGEVDAARLNEAIQLSLTK